MVVLVQLTRWPICGLRLSAERVLSNYSQSLACLKQQSTTPLITSEREKKSVNLHHYTYTHTHTHAYIIHMPHSQFV